MDYRKINTNVLTQSPAELLLCLERPAIDAGESPEVFRRRLVALYGEATYPSGTPIISIIDEAVEIYKKNGGML